MAIEAQTVGVPRGAMSCDWPRRSAEVWTITRTTKKARRTKETMRSMPEEEEAGAARGMTKGETQEESDAVVLKVCQFCS